MVSASGHRFSYHHMTRVTPPLNTVSSHVVMISSGHQVTMVRRRGRRTHDPFTPRHQTWDDRILRPLSNNFHSVPDQPPDSWHWILCFPVSLYPNGQSNDASPLQYCVDYDYYKIISHLYLNELLRETSLRWGEDISSGGHWMGTQDGAISSDQDPASVSWQCVEILLTLTIISAVDSIFSVKLVSRGTEQRHSGSDAEHLCSTNIGHHHPIIQWHSSTWYTGHSDVDRVGVASLCGAVVSTIILNNESSSLYLINTAWLITSSLRLESCSW